MPKEADRNGRDPDARRGESGAADPPDLSSTTGGDLPDSSAPPVVLSPRRRRKGSSIEALANNAILTGPKKPKGNNLPLGADRVGTRRQGLSRIAASLSQRDPDSLSARCDPSTYRLWLWTASARFRGIDAAGISATLGVEREIIDSLLSSSSYLLFEAEFRRICISEESLQAARARVLAGCQQALDTLERCILAWREDPKNPQLLAIGRLASKDWLAAAGLVTDRSVRTVRRVEIPGRVLERLAGVVGQDGAGGPSPRTIDVEAETPQGV